MDKRRIVLILFVAFAVTLFSSFASAEDQKASGNEGLKIVDVVVVKPISAGVSFLSTVVYIGTFPFTFLAGQSERAEEVLVQAPWRFTHARALGEIKRYRDEVPEIGPPSLSKPSTY